jgi:hypothetical protein
MNETEIERVVGYQASDVLTTEDLLRGPDGPPIPDRLVQVSLKNLGMKPVVQNDLTEGKPVDLFDKNVDLAVQLVRKMNFYGLTVRSVSISHDVLISIDFVQ